MFKSISIALLILTTSACSAVGGQSVKGAHETLGAHLDKVSMGRSFCEGQTIKFYYESTYSYSITCRDGRHYTLKK